MIKQVLLTIGLFSILKVHGTQDLEGCNVGTTHENSDMRRLSLKTLEYNTPKKEEVIRLKFYFNGRSPAISISENGSQIVFGYNHKDSKQFGIYLTHEDWMSAENACHLETTDNAFSNQEYTELDMALQKGEKFAFRWECFYYAISDGRFFVIVYGKKGFAVSCDTKQSFSMESTILIGYAGNKGVHNFFYDCPMRHNRCKAF